MNIFYLNPNPTLCAQAHCDKHVVKMILETAQMLCSASKNLGYEIPCGYRSTHKNHPCTLWMQESADNMRWSIELFAALNKEYEYRYFPKEHASKYLLIHFENMYANLILLANRDYPKAKEWSLKGITTRPQCMPPAYKHINVLLAYQNYYCAEKLRFARWTRREKPRFVLQYLQRQAGIISIESTEKYA